MWLVVKRLCKICIDFHVFHRHVPLRKLQQLWWFFNFSGHTLLPSALVYVQIPVKLPISFNCISSVLMLANHHCHQCSDMGMIPSRDPPRSSSQLEMQTSVSLPNRGCSVWVTTSTFCVIHTPLTVYFITNFSWSKQPRYTQGHYNRCWMKLRITWKIFCWHSAP